MIADQTYYDVAMRRLDEQLQRIDVLDAKVATTFGFSAAILPVFGALLALTRKDRPEAALILYVIAMGVYVVMLWFAWRSYQVGRWSLRPDLPTLREHCQTFPDETMRVWVANECLSSIAKNEPRLHTKAVRVRLALGFLVVEVLLLALAALFSLA